MSSRSACAGSGRVFTAGCCCIAPIISRDLRGIAVNKVGFGYHITHLRWGGTPSAARHLRQRQVFTVNRRPPSSNRQRGSPHANRLHRLANNVPNSPLGNRVIDVAPQIAAKSGLWGSLPRGVRRMMCRPSTVNIIPARRRIILQDVARQVASAGSRVVFLCS